MDMIDRARDVAGHPTHPPMTGITIGSYTVAVIALSLGALGFSTADMAIVAYWSTIAGLCFGLVTIITGLLDFVSIASDSPLQRVALGHLILQVVASAMFAISAIYQAPDYHDATIAASSMIVSVVGYAALMSGAWLGGTMVFRMGARVATTNSDMAGSNVPTASSRRIRSEGSGSNDPGTTSTS